MELRYKPPSIKAKPGRNARILAALPACFGSFAAEWVKAGWVAAAVTAGAGWVLVAFFLLRRRSLIVVANDHGLRVVGWFSSHTWPWDAIRSIDYFPRRVLGTRLPSGRITLDTGGYQHFISALDGSVSGDNEIDDTNRAFIRELNVELSKYRRVTSTG